jgi:iron complex outermembrane receptor protein
VVWPDAALNDQGFYVQILREGEHTELAGTVRLDRVQATAGTFSDFFAANTEGGLDQEETHLSAALNGRWSISRDVSLTAGLGRAVRTATVLERYSDRFPATKFQIAAEFMGNPALNPEASLEFNVGGSLLRERTHLGLDLFHREIDNYITVQADPSLRKRLPLSPPLVFRYINGSEARFHGAELTLEQDLTSVFRLRGFLSYVWGVDELFGEPILGLPPFQGLAALELSSPDRRYWVDLAVTLVDSQTRVASRRFEQMTDGYTIVDLRGRASLTSGWTLKAGVENLGDRLYSNHLNSPNPFNRRRIPELGRNFYVGLVYEF